jgi:hypothetical protein
LKWALYGKKFKRVDIAELLIEKGADINIGINISGYIQSDPSVVDFLLENHYDLNLERKDRLGRNLTTPLINVCAKGTPEYVMKFIAAGADVNFASSTGNTPLLSAIASGKLEIVKILVDSGADVNQQSKRGATPFLVASANGQKEIADYLKSKGADTKGWTTNPITLALLKKAGLVPDDADGISNENLKLLLAMLKEEYGISSIEKLNKPDPRFSSPEKTWQMYKKALIDGDLELAALCHLPRNHYIEFYRKMGPEKTKELAQNFRPIEKITGDDKRIKYRIKRLQSGKDITYYIYFTNVFGEWKIEQF